MLDCAQVSLLPLFRDHFKGDSENHIWYKINTWNGSRFAGVWTINRRESAHSSPPPIAPDLSSTWSLSEGRTGPTRLVPSQELRETRQDLRKVLEMCVCGGGGC